MLQHQANHDAHHMERTFANPFAPVANDLVRVGSRRWFLQTGLAGIGGLSLAQTLKLQAQAGTAGGDRKSVILFWLSGGPSHLDMWDPKPDAPKEIRGPYKTIQTAVPGVQFCEHLPLQASIMDKLTVIRSVDCTASDHTPITMQACNELARRTNDGRDGAGYPSMGSIAAKFKGPNNPAMPAFVALADAMKADVWGAGHMGTEYEPIQGSSLQGRIKLPQGVHVDHLRDRQQLREKFDALKRELDQGQAMSSMDRYTQLAYEMVSSGQVERAFNLDLEPDAMRDAYGRESIGEKALLARRLVEAGSTFVLVSGAWGYFDHHGDEVKWKGIEKGLTPILPSVDRVMYALINDLETRGLLDNTLVLMMGEFGRSPVMTKTNGRGHWTNCMSMLVAGGGLPTGQVIGATDRKGYYIQEDIVRPADIAATVFKHLGIDLQTHWVNPQGRPIPIVTQGGKPIPGLS